MKQLISIKDIEDLLRKGGDPGSLPQDALYTPSARDRLHALKTAPNGASEKNPQSSVLSPQHSPVEQFFHSKELQGVTFEELKVGDAVSFDVTEGEKGPAATNVQRA